MFECGLEDINLKAAKRSGFKTGWSVEEDENMANIDSMLQTMDEKYNSSQRHPSNSSNGELIIFL